MLEIDDKELKVFIGRLKRFPGKQRDAQDRVFHTNAIRLRDAVRANASGRPGPRVVTGRYVASIEAVRQRSLLGGTTWSVATDAPQARRLELGFIGEDSMGRMYHQPPFPHWQPGVDEIIPLLVSESSDTVVQAWDEM